MLVVCAGTALRLFRPTGACCRNGASLVPAYLGGLAAAKAEWGEVDGGWDALH